MALALPAGQSKTAFTRKGIEALGKRVDTFPRIRGFSGALNVGLGYAFKPVADVLPGIGSEDDRGLRHQRHAPEQLLRIGITGIDTIGSNQALIRVVEAQRQLQDR